MVDVPSTWWRHVLHAQAGLVLCALLGFGCAAAPQPRVMVRENVSPSSPQSEINAALASASHALADSSLNYRMGAEDLLWITILNVPENGVGPISRKTEVQITQDGMIHLPLLGEIHASGLTVAGLEQSLRQRYGEFMHDPHITVQIKEYHGQQVSILGAVVRPGVYQLTGPRTLLDLLSMAGGVNDKTGNQVHLYRRGPQGSQTYVIDLLALVQNPELVNMPVQSGDKINVPLAGTFFVDGAVERPGAYPLARPYTLTQALTVAGGVQEALAAYSDVSIFRRQPGTEPTRIPVDLKAIFAGTLQDPNIQTDDVIIVPTSTAKYIVERFIGRIGLGAGSMF